MSKAKYLCSLGCLALASLLLSGCGTVSVNGATSYPLTVTPAGTGTGTITSSPAGINCGPTCSATFDAGTAITLSQAVTNNSTFAGWSGACTGTGTCTVTMAAATSVTATFNAATTPPPTMNTLTVQDSGTGTGTVTSSPAGISCGSTCSASFTTGSAITLTAAPAAGSTFTGWSGACSGTSTCAVTLSADTTVTATFTAAAPVYQLTITPAGTGTGTVTSSPAGINCGTTCTAGFDSTTAVTLTAAPTAGSVFGGWNGGSCTGTGPCTLTLAADTTITATFNTSATAGLSSINHIIYLTQENRSLDNYFGAMRQYWADNGYPDQSFDGLPQFNPVSGAAPLRGPAPSIPGCDPSVGPPANCLYDTSNPVTSFHLNTQCTENTSPTWDEAHADWNFNDQVGRYGKPKMDGFVHTAAHDARTNTPQPFLDINGIRAMGYYDGNDLNFYYFMASNFATSDRWFHPMLSRTNPNREFMIAATSNGYVYPNGANANDTAVLKQKTIFQDMQDNGVTWKIYVNPGTVCSGPPYDPACLMKLSYLQNFKYNQTVLQNFPQNIGTIQDYFNDVQNGTLPQVVWFEPASEVGLDEHGSDSDAAGSRVQKGAEYAESLINALMTSQYWADSAIVVSFDESGGLYDHVPPQPAVSPDGIAPVDLYPTDTCYGTPSLPLCDFKVTGYRTPMVVISPFAKKNYVSHTVMDSTAVLKLIETRFSLPPLNARDAAQPDMTEFFDFNNPAWITPPVPPAQHTNMACYLNKLP